MILAFDLNLETNEKKLKSDLKRRPKIVLHLMFNQRSFRSKIISLKSKLILMILSHQLIPFMLKLRELLHLMQLFIFVQDLQKKSNIKINDMKLKGSLNIAPTSFTFTVTSKSFISKIIDLQSNLNENYHSNGSNVIQSAITSCL